jgi:imidazolonepropionase-like amidohydrolase
MRTAIVGGTVVAGDGSAPRTGAAVVLADATIEGIDARWPDGSRADVIIDATGCLVMPGLINCHTHGVTPGPLFPSAAAALPDAEWQSNLDRHLLAGTTTVLNLCGLATMAEVEAADAAHPVKVKGATSHLPSAIAAARAADGAGLRPEHAAMTAEAMVSAGAVAIGELGGGQTLGGGGQDLQYIPAAIERITATVVTAAQARAIKDAVLGPHLDRDRPDEPALAAALTDAGLAPLLDPNKAADLIRGCVLPSLHSGLAGIREGVLAAATLGVPAVVHSASASAALLRELAADKAGRRATVIAGHSNHTSFTPDEALATARDLADHGWLLECCTFDLLELRHTVTTRDHWDRLLADGDSVTLLATDYGYLGQHDPLISGVSDLVAAGHRSLGAAVAMASGNVAEAVPGLAPGAGRLAAGLAADLVIAEIDTRRMAGSRNGGTASASNAVPGRVRHVFVDGHQVVRNGSITTRSMSAGSS